MNVTLKFKIGSRFSNLDIIYIFYISKNNINCKIIIYTNYGRHKIYIQTKFIYKEQKQKHQRTNGTYDVISYINVLHQACMKEVSILPGHNKTTPGNRTRHCIEEKFPGPFVVDVLG